MAQGEGDEARVETVGRLSADEIVAVTWLTEAATDADGVRPLSEHVALHLRYGGDDPARNVLVYAPASTGAGLVGYAHLDPTDAVSGSSAELVVHPQARRGGYGRLLVQTLAAATPDGRLRLWAHGRLPPAEALARAMGFELVRELRQLRRSLFAPLPAPAVPGGVQVRPFAVGSDEDAWVELNALAFAGHPEQGRWTRADLDRRMDEPWFDPAGFFLAERDGRLVGFHWTKIHGEDAGHHGGGPDDPHDHGEGQPRHGHDPIGEVYVVGVDPGEQGSGLGRALTLVGLHHLRRQGLPAAMLYVDADNPRAIALYTGLGFAIWDVDVLYSRDLPAHARRLPASPRDATMSP